MKTLKAFMKSFKVPKRNLQEKRRSWYNHVVDRGKWATA